jgi:GMP synthase (glutamine-hydrolysing)
MAVLPKVLLLQARRPDDPEREAERLLFARQLEISEEQVASHNLIDGVPGTELMRAYDAILIGGSGDYYVSDGTFPEQDRVFDVLREAVEGPVPIFGSCFGFHLMTAALGGEIIHDPARIELGTYELELTDEGRRDELFGILPDGFLAQLGRKDRARRLPGGVDNLARSERCPLQGFRYGRRPVWATQFHPELDAKTNQRRYLVYVENYEGYLDEAERTEVMSRFRESPATAGLLPRFLELAL